MTDKRLNVEDTVDDPDDIGSAGAEGPARPISSYLFFLVTVCLVPAFLFSGFLLIRSNTVQQAGLESLFQSNTRSIVQVMEQEISGMLTTLRVLSSDPTFAERDYAEFHDRARRALIGRDMTLSVIDDDLSQLLNTGIEFGSPLFHLSDRATPRRAFETRAPVISGVVFSQTALGWVFYVGLPVFPKNEDPILLALTRSAESLAPAVQSGRLPGDWQVAIVDSTGTVLVSSDESMSPGAPLPFSVDNLADSSVREVELRDQTFQIIRERSALTDWSVVAWTPQEKIRAPVLRSIALLVLGGVSIGILAAIAAWFVGSRVARSAKRLSHSARRLGAGEEVEPTQHSISEFAVVSTALSDAARERSEAENEIRLLMREVAHRSKNQLTVINAMVGQTAKNAVNVEEFVESLRRRISGLARSTDLLLANAARGIDFRSLIEIQLEPFMPSDAERVRMLGPAVKIDAQPAQTVGMAIHELATNAAKYGALADEDSRLEITWWRREGKLSLTWREYVDGLDEPPDRKGFGSVVLERMMGGTLDADITRTLHKNGIEWHFAIPLERLRT